MYAISAFMPRDHPTPPLVDDCSSWSVNEGTRNFLSWGPDARALRPTGPVVRGRVRPPRPQSNRSGEDELILKYHLATSHPTYAAMVLADPNAMDTMLSEYLAALKYDDNYPECWWTAGHNEQEIYRRLVEEAKAEWAPKPRYEAAPGISTGNGAWPFPQQPSNGRGEYDVVYGVTVDRAFEYLIGRDGKKVPIWEDLRFTTPPERVFQAAARNGLIPSVYQVGTEPGKN